VIPDLLGKVDLESEVEAGKSCGHRQLPVRYRHRFLDLPSQRSTFHHPFHERNRINLPQDTINLRPSHPRAPSKLSMILEIKPPCTLLPTWDSNDYGNYSWAFQMNLTDLL
jgi:hypothetical protein